MGAHQRVKGDSRLLQVDLLLPVRSEEGVLQIQGGGYPGVGRRRIQDPSVLPPLGKEDVEARPVTLPMAAKRVFIAERLELRLIHDRSVLPIPGIEVVLLVLLVALPMEACTVLLVEEGPEPVTPPRP
jgi:hypothetical protein